MHTPGQLRDRANEYREVASRLDTHADQLEAQESEIASLFSAELDGGDTKKKRGRPAKAKRGRPAGVKANKGKGTGKRGRPPGSKNKPKEGEAAPKKAATTTATKKRGRPAKAKTAAKTATKKRGRPAKTETTKAKRAKPEKSEGKLTLGDLILEILKEKENRDGLNLAAMVAATLARGYKTESEKFSTIVYQTLRNLSKKEKQIEKGEDRKYRLKKAA